MNLPTGLVIFLIVLFLFLQYVVIETAVRRGIDTSKTSKMIKEFMEKNNQNN
ncbi:hypothetical protein FIU87_03555 [Bacillus sp. THAF10]|uniref:hypothetical protein n=1 Tax=Bacillus sp. THAF10 TaxID=2587848 RepID=UPI0012A96C24|nr:hypothetical protein [Bacillus sp. THAF10]QFT87719.1 hypothetical protein FIU87_03555 [Bacillus sp. THAF10]